MTEPRTLPHSHGRCGTRWAGANTAHCGACCETMTGPTAFDRHRRDGRCLDPTDAGLVLRNRSGYTVWGWPGERPDMEDEPEAAAVGAA